MALTFPRAFRDFDVFPSRMERLFDEMMRGTFDRPIGREWMSGAWSPSMEVYEREDEMLVEAELPGLQPNDVDIRVDNNILTVRGERKMEDETKRGRAHRQEFCYGTFVRSIALPATIDQDEIQAELKDGVLRVRLPKAEQARPRQIQIQGAGQAQQLPTTTGGQAPAATEPELAGAGAGTTGKRR